MRDFKFILPQIDKDFWVLVRLSSISLPILHLPQMSKWGPVGRNYFAQSAIRKSCCRNMSKFWYHDIFKYFGILKFPLIFSDKIHRSHTSPIGQNYFDQSAIRKSCCRNMSKFWYHDIFKYFGILKFPLIFSNKIHRSHTSPVGGIILPQLSWQYSLSSGPRQGTRWEGQCSNSPGRPSTQRTFTLVESAPKVFIRTPSGGQMNIFWTDSPRKPIPQAQSARPVNTPRHLRIAHGWANLLVYPRLKAYWRPHSGFNSFRRLANWL